MPRIETITAQNQDNPNTVPVIWHDAQRPTQTPPAYKPRYKTRTAGKPLANAAQTPSIAETMREIAEGLKI